MMRHFHSHTMQGAGIFLAQSERERHVFIHLLQKGQSSSLRKVCLRVSTQVCVCVTVCRKEMVEVGGHGEKMGELQRARIPKE